MSAAVWVPSAFLLAALLLLLAAESASLFNERYFLSISDVFSGFDFLQDMLLAACLSGFDALHFAQLIFLGAGLFK